MAFDVTEDFITLTATGDQVDSGVIVLKTDDGSASGPIQLKTGNNDQGPSGGLQLKIGEAQDESQRGSLAIQNPYVIDLYPYGDMVPVGEQSYGRKLNTNDASMHEIWSVYNLDDSVMMIKAKVLARQTNGDCAVYELSRSFKNVGSSVTSSSLSKSVVYEDDASWDCDLDVDSGQVRLRVQGASSDEINWYASVEVIYNAL